MQYAATYASFQSSTEPNTLHFVSDDELLVRTRELARHETELTIVTIQHLDEIERRELYDMRGYASLLEYAVRELHYSKGCAWRRIMVMKLCRAVPGIADKLRSGELNLTTASQLQNAIEKRARKAARKAVHERASEAVSVPAAGAVSARAEESAAGESAAALPLPAGAAAMEVGAAEILAPAQAGTTGAAPAAAVAAEPGKSPHETAAARAAGEAAVAAPAALASAAASPVPGAARESAALPPVAEPPPAWTLDQKVELVDLVANKSARETEKLLAELEPEVGLPRERQRALGSGRYEVRVILDQGSVDTIAKLKGWLSHVNPGFTTGQLLAHLLQQAERKYDPMRERGRAKRGAAATAKQAEAHEQQLGVITEGRASGGVLGAGVGASEAGSSTCATGALGASVPATGTARGSVAAGTVAGAPAPGSAAAGSAAAGYPAPGPAAAGPSGTLAGGSAQNRGAQPVAAPASAQDRRDTPGSAQNRGAQPVAAPASAQDRRDTPGSAQNQQPPRAGNVRSRTDTEPHRGARTRLSGVGSAAPAPSAESARERRARRHIPAAVRRAVWRRDGGACCYQDPLTGVTCGSTHLVQIDHIVPVAQGGGDDIPNLRLRCAVHNRRRDPRCTSYRSAPAAARSRSHSISSNQYVKR